MDGGMSFLLPILWWRQALCLTIAVGRSTSACCYGTSSVGFKYRSPRAAAKRCQTMSHDAVRRTCVYSSAFGAPGSVPVADVIGIMTFAADPRVAACLVQSLAFRTPP
jgi:hypothetical protein